MENKIEELFPWCSRIQTGFLESFCGDYDIGMLKQLQQNIAEEIEKVEGNCDLKTAKLLLKGVEYFYYHFCRIWNCQNKVYPYFFEFSSHMKNTWVHTLSSYVKICLLLSRGKEKSKWISRALKAIARFPGEKNLIYDALLFVHTLNNKYKPAYGAILKSLLMDMSLFVPLIIDHPAEFLKVYLLVRRLKLRMKDRAEKAELLLKASKILAPSSLWDWLLDHDFSVPWTRKGIKKVNLGTNICRKLEAGESQLEIVKTLRKILLPGLCTERKAEQQRPCIKKPPIRRNYVSVTCDDQVSSEDDKEIASENKIKTRINSVSVVFTAQGPSEYKKITTIETKNKMKTCVSVSCSNQILSEDGKEEIAVNETKVKSKKLKRRRNKPQEDGEEFMNVSRPEMRKPIGTLEDVVDSEENVSRTVNHNSAISTFDNGKLVSEKKNRKKQKSVHLEENLEYKTGHGDLPFQECSSESVKLATEKIKKRRKKLDKIAGKILNKANQSIDKDSCLLEDSTEDMEQSAGGRKRPEMEYKKKQQGDCMDNSDFEVEPKSKKRRQREKVVAEKNPDNVNATSCNHSLLEDISQTSKITKSRRKRAKQLGSNSKETEFIAINDESDAEDLPLIVDEIHVNKPVPNERVCLPESRIVDSGSSCSDDDHPVILSEVKHCLDLDLNSSHRKKNKDIKTELKANPGAENKIMAENIFIIDSEPSPCFSESDASQIKYNTIYDAGQKDASSCEKPENISNNGEDLKSSGPLADLQDEDLPAESSSRLKITDYSHTSEETQGSFASSSSPFRSDRQEPTSEKEIRTLSDNQTSINMNGQDCKCEDGDNVNSSTVEEHSGHTAQTDEESSRDSAVQTESLDYSPNQTSDLVENCIKSDPTSKKLLMDGKEKIPIRTDFEKETTRKTNISQETVPVLESHGSPVSGRSCLNGDPSVQEIEMQKEEHPSIETNEFVFDNVYFAETNHMDTENNAKVIVGSELPFKNSALSCEVKKEEITREFESSIDSPLSNTSCLKPSEISSQIVAETMSSESVHISSAERKNLENIENICITEIRSEAPLENSVSSLLENRISLQIIPINTNNSSQETVIKEEKLTSDSSLPDNVNSDSNSSFEVDNLEVKKERDNISIDMQRPSQNNSIHDQPKYEVTGLFFYVKSPISETEVGLHEDSERSPNHHILDDLTTQNLDGEAKSIKVETPNTSAAKVMIESVLKLAEFAGCRKESISNINKGDHTSTLNSLSVKNLSKLISSAANEKPAECLSFLDISTENVDGLNESQSFACHTPEISEFFQYRDLSSDQDDNRSEDTLSESKSILKTDASEYHSDASNEAEDEESNSSPSDCNSSDASNFKNNCDTYVVKTECSWDDAITRQQFYKNDVDEHDARSSKDNQIDISTKTMQLKRGMLNPVVNLGERCDSNSFIDMLSTVSADSLNIPTNSFVLSDIKAEDVEINETEPFKSYQASLTADQLHTPFNKGTRMLQAIKQSASNTQKHDVNIDVKIEIQPVHKDVNELCLIADQELTVSDEDRESIELTREKELSQDHEITGCDKGQELTETRKERELSLGIKLRKRPATAVQTEKSMPGNEGSRVLNQDASATHCMNLKSRKPSTSSSQGKSASADESSSVVNQDTPTTQCMDVMSRNPSTHTSSSQGKFSSANKGSSVVNQDTPTTQCMNVRSGNPSTSSTQGKSASADEGSSVVNQDTPTTPCMNLRSRNPSESSSQGKSASADESSSVLNQDTPTTQCMNVMSRNPSTSSSQGKSSSADKNSSVCYQVIPATQCMNLRSRNPSMFSSQGKSVPVDEGSSMLNQDIPATRCMNLRSRNSSASSIQEVMKLRSQTVTKRSSKRLKKEVNLNLGLEFSGLSLNSPKSLRSKPNGSSNKNSSEVVKDKSPTSDQGNPCRRLTRASVISSTVGTMQDGEEDIHPEGYNLRSRKSVIMPGKLKF